MDESGWRAKVLSLVLLWLVTLVHCRGLAGGGRLQRIITSTKVLAIGLLILGAQVLFGFQFEAVFQELLQTSLPRAAMFIAEAL